MQETVSCANGTDAIVLVLDAMGIGPGDEVVCPAFTFYATAEAIARRGATPVFAEIDPVDAQPRSRRTSSGGSPSGRRRSCRCTCSAGPRRSDLGGFGLPVIEDAAQAFGAGGIATSIASTFSFFPTKNLFALGDGGLIARQRRGACRASAHAALPRLAGEEGVRATSATTRASTRCRRRSCASSCRTSTVERAAARGGGALHRAARRARRDARRRAGPRLPHVLRPLPGARPARGRARRRPRSASPSTTNRRCTCSRRSRYLGYSEGDFPETEKASRENLCLPLWAGITEEQQAEVVSVLKSASELVAR